MPVVAQKSETPSSSPSAATGARISHDRAHHNRAGEGSSNPFSLLRSQAEELLPTEPQTCSSAGLSLLFPWLRTGSAGTFPQRRRSHSGSGAEERRTREETRGGQRSRENQPFGSANAYARLALVKLREVCSLTYRWMAARVLKAGCF